MNRRVFLFVAFVVFGGLAIWIWRTYRLDLSPIAAREFLAGLGPWGPIALIMAVTFILVIPVVPATIFQIAAGLAFGPPLGLAYVLVGDVLGATIGFWIARRGRGLLESRLSEQNRATLERLSKRVTWRSMLLLRLLPGPAYPLVSFAAGYSPISFLAYIVSSFVGVLPSLALLVLAGELVTSSPLLAFGVVALLAGGLALAGKILIKENSQ